MINIKNIVFNRKLVIIVGICICILAVIDFFHLKIYFDTAKATTATITDIRVRYSHSRHSYHSTRNYYYSISYKADGKEYDNVDIGRQSGLPETEGEQVTVYYQSYAPGHAIPYKDPSFSAFIFLLAGIIVIIYGINCPQQFRVTY